MSRAKVLLLLLVQVLWLCPALSGAATRPTWQMTDSSAVNYLTNRRALVGSGCMVNRLGSDGVKVVPVITNLQNLTDENLDNVTEIGLAVDLTVGANPLISVRDVKNYYAAGTEAGFVVTGESSGLLKLDVGEFYQVMFYCDGKLVDTESLSQGKSGNGLGLSLIQISSSTASVEYVATSKAKFDEIRLVQIQGIEAEVAKVIGLKYAFVGKAKEYTITQSSMKQYAKDQGREGKFTTKSRLGLTDNELLSSEWKTGDNLDDDDTTNVAIIAAGLVVGETLHACVRVVPADGKEVFKKGTTVGFKYNSTTVLNLSIGSAAEIVGYDKANNEVFKKKLDASVLGLNLISGKSGSIAITADTAFSKVCFYFIKGVQVTAGIIGVNYAYIQMPPEIEKHQCPINASASINVCDCDNQYQLSHNDSIPVTWSIASQPGNSASVNSNGLVTGLADAGKYVFVATAADNCTDTVVINYGATEFPKQQANVMNLVNTKGSNDYEAITKGSFGITIGTDMQNSTAVVSPSLRDYAYGAKDVSLAENEAIIGVKKTNGTLKFDTDKKVGFVVSTKTSGLNANLIDLFSIKLYKDGKEVESSLVKDNGVLKASAIGSSKVLKTTYAVKVPAGTEFDAVVLYRSGVLNINLSDLNVYNAFVSDPSSNIEKAGTVVSYNNTGASIDAANTKFVAVANVANTPFGLTNLVDDDIDSSAVVLPAVTVAEGGSFGVNIGKTVNSAKQSLTLVTSNSSYVLSADLVKVLQIELWKDGKKVADSGSDWSTLNANVVGLTDNHNYINIKADKDFDEVVLKYGSGADVADEFKIYGMILRNDYNGDGVADEIDPAPCAQEVVFNEDTTLAISNNYSKATMVFKRSFNKGVWNSVILPVNLTKAQFEEAFGTDAKLSAFDKVTEGTNNTTLNFALVKDEENGVFMKKNTPYIIYITKVADTEGKYETISGNELEGAFYIVEGDGSSDGVDYKADDNTPGMVSNGDATFYGSYNSETSLSKGWYVFNKGDLYHLTKEGHTQKAYRCWLEYNPATSEGKTLGGFDIDNDNTTFIRTVVEDAAEGNGKLYNLSGMRVNAAEKLSKGVYILNGKKFIVK